MRRRADAICLLLILVATMVSCTKHEESNPPAVTSAPVQSNAKYDDAEWHYGGEFPKELPEEAGATHIGMFAAWAMLAGLNSEEFASDVKLLKSRKMTPGQFIMEQWDGVFHPDMLNDEGNRFAAVYFQAEDGNFLKDYEATLEGKLPSLYHIKDSWENFDKIKPVFDRRLEEFRKKPN